MKGVVDRVVASQLRFLHADRRDQGDRPYTVRRKLLEMQSNPPPPRLCPTTWYEPIPSRSIISAMRFAWLLME